MHDRRFQTERRRLPVGPPPAYATPAQGDRDSFRQRPGSGPDSGPKSWRWPGAALLLCAALATLLAGCVNPGPPPQPRFEPPATISGTVTFASSALPPEQELEYLSHFHTPPALLRRAWLELQLGRAQESIDTSARVLYTDPKPSAHVESFARYLRAEAYRRQGHPERGNYDRKRAQALAMDPELQRRLLPSVLPPREAAGLPWGDLAVQRRGAWQPQRENQRNLDPMQRPRRVTIHHSAMFFRSTAPRAAAAQIARIQREHMNNRGYGDIGYHFLIDPSGRVWEGRQLQWQGAHASGSNNIANIGICLLGNFVRQRDGQGPTRDQVRAMERLVVNLMHHYRMRGNALFCHSDFKSTQCPGPRMAPIVKQFARQLRARGHVAIAEEDEEDDE